ncbi:MAG: FHA domain-containing protein [Myxococcota bacterium]
MTGFEIIVRQPGQTDRTMPLPPGSYSLGRAETNQIVLPDIGVSRAHARLSVSQTGVQVEDLGSGNGTWCRGHRIDRPRMMEPGEILLIDPFTIELRRMVGAPRYTPQSTRERASADARLDVIRGPNLAQGTYLVPAHGLSIGRSEFRDVVVLDPAASRHHCDVMMVEGRWSLVDRGSSNGIHVNEVRIANCELHHGDVLRIGNTEFRFVLFDTAASQTDSRTNEPAPSWDVESAVPAPGRGQTQTPPSRAPRAIGHTQPPEITVDEGRPRRGPWVPLAMGSLSVGMLALAAAILVGAGALLLMPRSNAVPLPPVPTPLPPSWTLDLDPATADLSVDQLFDEGVDDMRNRRSAPALAAFYRILLVEKGNRAAERWSFTAGEHLMLDTLENRLKETEAERTSRERSRDALLARYPRRDATEDLRERFRDDPAVLTRTGWNPSASEAALSKQLDAAIAKANAGDWTTARDGFEEVLGTTKNGVLTKRASFGLGAARRALADAVSTDWRLGVEAENRGDLVEAREAFRRVLAIDTKNPSARARLSYLGAQPASQ